MKPLRVERLAWGFIYGGLLGLCVGAFVDSSPPVWPALHLWVLGIAALALVIGVALVVLRARMRSEAEAGIDRGKGGAP